MSGLALNAVATLLVAALLAAPELTEQWTPVPRVVSTPVEQRPSDAIALFVGHDMLQWESADGKPARWKVEDGSLIVVPGAGDVRTKRVFGDVQLHLEFKTPVPAQGSGQARGNSGVFFMGLYELQILDSYQNETYVNGQAASIYKQFAPLVNASRAPGEWQTYDVVFRAPRFTSGNVTAARMTVFHNGVLVHDDVPLRGGTVFQGEPSYASHSAMLPLSLQDHGVPVAFRNIWVRPLDQLQ